MMRVLPLKVVVAPLDSPVKVPVKLVAWTIVKTFPATGV